MAKERKRPSRQLPLATQSDEEHLFLEALKAAMLDTLRDLTSQRPTPPAQQDPLDYHDFHA